MMRKVVYLSCRNVQNVPTRGLYPGCVDHPITVDYSCPFEQKGMNQAARSLGSPPTVKRVTIPHPDGSVSNVQQ